MSGGLPARRARCRLVPASRAAKLVGGTRGRLELATLRVHSSPVDERRCHQPVPIRLVAGASAFAQPRDAGRRVARTALVVRWSAAATRSPRRERVVAKPGERPRAGGVVRRRRLPPGRDLADEWDALLQLAHPIDQAVGLGPLGREDLGRRSVPRPPEELGKSAIGLEVAADHDRVVRLERLGHTVHQWTRESERVPHLADRGPRPVRDEVADHPGVLGSVALVDVLDDFLAALRGEVDVDVRVGRPARVDEALEQQVVGDRLDPADAQYVRHDRAGRTAPTLRRDPTLLRELHQVPADEEELGEAGPLDDVELVREPGHDRRGHRVVAAARAGPA